MTVLGIVLLSLAGLAVLVLLAAAVCFFIVFYSPPHKPLGEEEFSFPAGKLYAPYHEHMRGWMREMRTTPHEDIAITSFDGLTLYGSFYNLLPGAPIELMFHGYRGTAERDLCGGFQRCLACRRNALIVDQRAAERSDGHVISFGINEHRDCLSWIDYTVSRFGPDVRIVLTGISMGAATVLMAAGEDLPEQVVGVLADCGYTSPRAIIQKCTRQLHLPVFLMYPLIRLSAKLFGGFDLEAGSPIEAMRRCRVPVLFVHGEADDFVPCEMSRENYDACTAPKRLVTIPGAGHGLSCLVDRAKYLDALEAFGAEHGW